MQSVFYFYLFWGVGGLHINVEDLKFYPGFLCLYHKYNPRHIHGYII